MKSLLFKGRVCCAVAALLHSTAVFASEAAHPATAAGSKEITIAAKDASIVVSLFGGRILSFKKGDEEILWRPRAWRHEAGSWRHGGIPLCWPWFGLSNPESTIKHGFAWYQMFEVRSQKTSPERCELVLGLKSSPSTHAIWPYDFDLEYTIVLTDRLSMKLRTKNTGTKPLPLTVGFHPYFLIGDRDRTSVTGMDGLKFCDSRRTERLDGVWKGDMKLLSSFDHVFVEPRATALHQIKDPVLKRTVSVSSSGAKRLVVWNPGAEAPAQDMPAPGDFGKGDWRRMICVEPAILWKDAIVTVEPGSAHEIFATIDASRE